MRPSLSIGIDTGGTYTDAVLYDTATGTVLHAAKSLTTREDLSIGILGALDQFPRECLCEVTHVCLSTTLATNAAVEDKGGSAKLIFFGGHEREVNEYGGAVGLPPAEDILLMESHTTFSGDCTAEPDWEYFDEQVRNEFHDLDGVGIIEVYANNNAAIVEKVAKARFAELLPTPVVCGHELFSELNSLRRASGTLLNAKLFSVIHAFLQAIRTAMQQRGIHAPISIVRSDGSLMSEDFARTHPVETLLCGPASSVIGGAHLSHAANAVVVDMGGTTTDIAIVRDFAPNSVVGGVAIGRWKTFVDGFAIQTAGLGGDSAIHYRNGELILEEYRVIPLCVAAEKHPQITENLRILSENRRVHTRFLYEHYLLQRDISASTRYTAEEKAFCDGLRDGPVPITEAALAIGKDMYTFDAARLLREGIVQLCGLTPTDIMHLRGDFRRYPCEASQLAAEFAAHNLQISVEELGERVYDEVKRRIYHHIVKLMLEDLYPVFGKKGLSQDIDIFINETYRTAVTGRENPLLALRMKTDFVLVGIGAPIRVFLPDVAKALGTTAVIPEYYEVANAVGAVVGQIRAGCRVEIRSCPPENGKPRFMVYGVDGNRLFEDLDEAQTHAISQAKKGAETSARARGAIGDLVFSSAIEQLEAPSTTGNVYLGTTITAQARSKRK